MGERRDVGLDGDRRTGYRPDGRRDQQGAKKINVSYYSDGMVC